MWSILLFDSSTVLPSYVAFPVASLLLLHSSSPSPPFFSLRSGRGGASLSLGALKLILFCSIISSMIFTIFILLSAAQSTRAYKAVVHPTYPPVGCQNYGVCASGITVTPYYNCTTCKCNAGYTGADCEIVVPVDICASNPCTGLKSVCLPHGTGKYECICPDGAIGGECELNSCGTTNPCRNGGRCLTLTADVFKCICPAGLGGAYCELGNPCAGINCGRGYCKVMDPQTFFCVCPPDGTYGRYCLTSPALPNPCDIASMNFCNMANSVCMPYLRVITCYCHYGWAGSSCTIPLWPMPCANVDCSGHGQCTYVPGSTAYSCLCDYGWTGTNCETQTYCGKEGSWWCKNGGDCVDNPDGTYYCNCLSNYYEERCRGYDVCQATTCSGRGTCSQVLQPEVMVMQCTCDNWFAGLDCSDDSPQKLVDAYGVENYLKIKDLVSDKHTNNANFLTSLPFMVMQVEPSVRETLGYQIDEFMVSVEFEGKALIAKEVFEFFMDNSLGNCYTFGSFNINYTFNLRSTGFESGLRVRVGSTVNESLAWDEKSAVTIFVHESTKMINSESINYNPIPGYITRMVVREESYTRLRMGSMFSMACARSVKDVGNFYSTGAYTIEACFRSCYQDMAMKMCGCMDPRYTMPNGTIKCALDKFDCCESIIPIKGDPSTWKGCFCPQACDERQFSVVMTSSTIGDDCNKFADNDTCFNDLMESDIEVVLSDSSHIMYVENAAFPLTRVVTNLGGYGGLLCAFCSIVLCELITLLWILCTAACRK